MEGHFVNSYKHIIIVALSAVGIHISIGSVYAWSVFTSPIQKQLGWGLSDIQKLRQLNEQQKHIIVKS